jgi:hypothetical protein
LRRAAGSTAGDLDDWLQAEAELKSPPAPRTRASRK